MALKEKLDWNESQLMDKKKAFRKLWKYLTWRIVPETISKLSAWNAILSREMFFPGAALVSVMRLTKAPLSLWLTSSERTLDTWDLYLLRGGWVMWAWCSHSDCGWLLASTDPYRISGWHAPILLIWFICVCLSYTLKCILRRKGLFFRKAAYTSLRDDLFW